MIDRNIGCSWYVLPMQSTTVLKIRRLVLCTVIRDVLLTSLVEMLLKGPSLSLSIVTLFRNTCGGAIPTLPQAQRRPKQAVPRLQ